MNSFQTSNHCFNFLFFFGENFFCVNIITNAENRHVDTLCETE